jgi:hypothetical protein
MYFSILYIVGCFIAYLLIDILIKNYPIIEQLTKKQTVYITLLSWFAVLLLILDYYEVYIEILKNIFDNKFKNDKIN